MAIESEIYRILTTSATLKAACSSNIFPVKRRQGSGMPAVVYTRNFGSRLYCLSGYSTVENPHFEVNIYSTALDDLRVIGNAMIDALSSADTFKSLVQPSPGDGWDDDIGAYTRTYDVSIWYHE